MDQTAPFDVLIIGSGAAGLSLALTIGERASCAVISKGPLQEGSTYYAQGGIAAVLDEKDSIDSHVADTLDAGDGLCDEKTVRFIAENAAAAIRRLAGMGVEFTHRKGENANEYDLTREGGHSHRRVVHAADATGRAVESTLVEKARQTRGLTVLEDHLAIDLILEDGPRSRCAGVYALDRAKGRITAIPARIVVLATGGASKVYLYTSNPDTSSGDGIAMAWRAGCRVANMEFTQFHPTCLYHPDARSFLITEALRGEGGKLILAGGKRFMDRFDKRAELAPRDIVARAIDHEMKRLGLDCVYLDISEKSERFIKDHFPTVYERCLEFGFDMSRDPIPVVPAAHYTCGGVMTDLRGRTDINGLYAIGEVAFTGLHGANRIASNSLLECVVMADAAAADIVGRLDGMAPPAPLAPHAATQQSYQALAVQFCDLFHLAQQCAATLAVCLVVACLHPAQVLPSFAYCHLVFFWHGPSVTLSVGRTIPLSVTF